MIPILKAYPELTYFRTRGTEGLSFQGLQHNHLRTLIVESGGLPKEIIQSILEAELPNLEHLELWLGSEDYGGDTTVEDLKPLLKDQLFPKLKVLALRNCEIADDIAKALAKAAILDRIETLDLSLGTLSETGLKVLLESGKIDHLKLLNISSSYFSDSMLQEIENYANVNGVTINYSNNREEEEEEERHVMVIG